MSSNIDISTNRRWTKKEEEHLISLSTYMSASEIADILNRTTKSVIRKMQRLGLQSVRSWTKKDKDFLMDYWGYLQVEVIANMLNRSVRAVREKAAEMNLLSAKNEAGFLKISDVAVITGLSIYKIKSFGKKGLKIKTNYITRKSKYYYIEMEDLMDFLERNQELYNAANFDLSYFYNIPDWLKKKKMIDMNAPQKGNWTQKEKELVKQMFLSGMDISEIMKQLNRTKYSIYHVYYEKSTS